MTKYRVTVRHTSVEIVEAANPYQAAVVASSGIGDGVEIADVRPAVGRIPATAHNAAAKTAKVKKKVVKNRRPLSPQARAKLAKNVVKASAARARNLRAAKKSTRRSTKKSAAKKTTKKAVKRR